jgi:predicted nucleotidyltransferase
MPAVRPSIALQTNREAIRAAAARCRTTNPRVFGSVARGEDALGSDLDLLVDPLPGATLFDLGGLQIELEELLGVHVDVLTPGDLPPRFRNQVLNEARPV